jgi:signal transduction histidine kinase
MVSSFGKAPDASFDCAPWRGDWPAQIVSLAKKIALPHAFRRPCYTATVLTEEDDKADTPASTNKGSTRRDRASVWVVDDSALHGEACRRALAEKYEVRVYEGGGQMLEELGQRRLPDVLVLDWHMPDMSGIEVCRFVRDQRNLAELPILILTAAGSTESLLDALRSGANDFVRKPFFESELEARVSTLARMSFLHGRLAEVEGRLRVEAEFRERFMGMLAHDLRQPLNAISMAALAMQAATPQTFSKFHGMQLRAVERMGRMIGELLDFTRNRPESGMPIQRESIDLAEIVQNVVDEIRVAHADHPLTLSVEGSCSGKWDADRLAQICSNLLGNAIEHSPAGSPVAVQLVGDDENVMLRVSNVGPAIPLDVQKTLFQPFRRGRRGTGKGLGLGLHIVDQIVRAHGGTIAVESDGSGSHFAVSLPRN